MLHRIRYAMQDETTGGKIGGPGCEIEADETMIGGKARNMHPGRRNKARQLDNFGKAVVSAVLERHGEVRATVIPNRRKKAIQAQFVHTWKPDRRSTATNQSPTRVGRIYPRGHQPC